MNELNDPEKRTTITITKRNRDKLKLLGYTADTYDQVLSNLFRELEEKRGVRIA